MYEFNKHTIEYAAAVPAELTARDAMSLLGLERMVTVLKHRATVQVEYLIELPDGSRCWETANDDTHS